MSALATQIDEALELGSLVLPSVEGHARFLDIEGMRARSTNIPSPFSNLAGRLRLPASTVSPSLDRLRAHFEAARVPFGVMVSHLAEPADLDRHLEARGIRPMQRCEALVLDDLDRDVPIDPRVVVERIGIERREPFSAVKAASFGMPVAVAQAIDAMLFGVASGIVFHLATIDGEPVGFSQTFYFGDVAILGGAGVVEKARGKGAFRTLLAERLRLARRDGKRAATIQAYDHTSAPILHRLGFTSRGSLHLWAWQPS